MLFGYMSRNVATGTRTRTRKYVMGRRLDVGELYYHANYWLQLWHDLCKISMGKRGEGKGSGGGGGGGIQRSDRYFINSQWRTGWSWVTCHISRNGQHLCALAGHIIAIRAEFIYIRPNVRFVQGESTDLHGLPRTRACPDLFFHGVDPRGNHRVNGISEDEKTIDVDAQIQSRGGEKKRCWCRVAWK